MGGEWFQKIEGVKHGITIYVSFNQAKQITNIVDVDDKNCLAESTVALKLNHGVRQWLYIIAGVLFFGSFFCTSKRKNIKGFCSFCLDAKRTKKIKAKPMLRRFGRASAHEHSAKL